MDVLSLAAECLAVLFCGLLANLLLDMKIVLCHGRIRMTNQALNGLYVNSKCLHLRYIGMPAGMRRQNKQESIISCPKVLLV